MQLYEDEQMTELRPDWVNLGDDELLLRCEFAKIACFFVVNSPCPKFATRGKELEFYNWAKKPWRTNRYLRKKLDAVLLPRSSSGKPFKVADRVSTVPAALRKAHLDDAWYEPPFGESFAFYNTLNNEYMSIFYHIRCAIAHGRFAIIEDGVNLLYLLENGEQKGNIFLVKARMIVKESTLSRWVEILTSGPDENEIDYRREVFSIIERDPTTTIKAIAKELEETEYIVRKALGYWKDKKVIAYKGHAPHGRWAIQYVRYQQLNQGKPAVK